MSAKTKWHVFCVLESLLFVVFLTIFVLSTSILYTVLYAVLTFLLIPAAMYVRKKKLSVLSVHEQMLWGGGPFSLFLLLDYVIFQYAPMLLAAAVCFVGWLVEWKCSFFSKRQN